MLYHFPSKDALVQAAYAAVIEALTTDAGTADLARRLEAEVAAGTTTPTAAARAVVAAHLGTRSSSSA